MSFDPTFWAWVDQTAGPEGCWPWQGATQRGYGAVKRDGARWRAHRFAYEQLRGPIPEGLTLDHLCRNRACCNPAHLEPVTVGENVLRSSGHAAINAAKTHCQHGHEFTPENTRLSRDGKRICRTCSRAYRARWEQRPERMEYRRQWARARHQRSAA